jgi:fatty-acyl-CoA synthase
MSASLPLSSDPIAAHARARPDALAAIDLTTGERLTYHAFDQRADDVARRLAGLIAPAGQRIAAVARNCIEMALLSAACERVGAVFTPLNWRLSAAELADIITDCAPGLVLTQTEFEGIADEAMELTKTHAPRLNLATLAGADATGPEADAAPADMQAPCIILYTSGTTGRAKGVVITRENALYSALNFAALAQVKPDSVLLCDSPMFHTVGLVAITRTALHQGACVALSDRFVPATTLERLNDEKLGVTHYFVVPQMVEALIREPAFSQADLSRLTALFSGGGPLSPELVKTCLASGVLLINGYGMSEVGSAIHMPLDRAFIETNIHTVGFPAPHIEIRLADVQGEPVKQGEVGEVWMRGPSISPGYWNHAAGQSVARSGEWFRSGDLALQQADGAYVIVDRLKDMYITGGENVYPAEVEAVVRQVDGVVDVAVVGVPDARWGEAGCAFIQLRAGLDIDSGDAEAMIRKALNGKLARYKLPAHLRFLDAIPRTGSGKARKNVLRDAFSSSSSPRGS